MLSFPPCAALTPKRQSGSVVFSQNSRWSRFRFRTHSPIGCTTQNGEKQSKTTHSYKLWNRPKNFIFSQTHPVEMFVHCYSNSSTFSIALLIYRNANHTVTITNRSREKRFILNLKQSVIIRTESSRSYDKHPTEAIRLTNRNYSVLIRTNNGVRINWLGCQHILNVTMLPLTI